MDILFYKNSAEDNRVDKTDFLEYVTTINGVSREENSIVEMSITIETDNIPNFNYCYIPILERYYFINDISFISNSLWEILISVDVLMTYKVAISKLSCFIDRNEFEYNSQLIDKNQVIEVGITHSTYGITNDVFFKSFSDSEAVESRFCYVLNGYKISVEKEE